MRRPNLTNARFAFVLFLAFMATKSAAVPPVPDRAFGLNGTVRAGDAGSPAITPTSIIGFPDGRVVVAGTSPLNTGTQTTILRYTATGLPDPSFNTTGWTTLPEVSYCLQSQRAVRQADDTIAVLMAASADPLCTTNVVSGAAILPDGTSDIAYRIDGLPQANVPRPMSVAQDNAANVYLVGVGEDAQRGYTWLTRLTPSGAVDPAFGLLTLEGGPGGVDRAGGVAPLSDGSLLTASLTGTLLYLLHSDAPGTPTPVVSGVTHLAVNLDPFAGPNKDRLRLIDFFRLADGANLVILKREGATSNGLLIVRTSGNLSNYGISLLISAPTTTDWPAAVALHDGTVVIAEVTGTGTSRQTSLRRMFANSSFDPTWGAGRAFALGAGTRVSALAEDHSGRLLVAGTDANGGFASRFQLTLDTFYETRFALEFWNSGLNHYFMTADPIEEDLIRRGSAGPGWIVTGGFRVYTDALGVPAGAVRVCRFYGNRAVNPVTSKPYGPNSHVFILDGPECDAVKADRGWIFEGYAFHAFAPVNGLCATGRDPVYRSYNNRFVQNDSNHRFTTSLGVYEQMRAAGWRGEGVVMFVPQ